jgi:hypothetical protein
VFNVFEMMQASHGNPGLDGLARQFGLSQEQATRAAAALLPAVFLGLQRSAADPNAFAKLMNGFNSGPFAAFFNDPSQPVPRQAQTQGELMLGQIFGSTELTRAVAEQAATWSGVGAQVIQQIMPIMAAAAVGSLSRFSGIMRGEAAGRPSVPPPEATPPLAQPFLAWLEMMRAMTPGAAPEPEKPALKMPGPVAPSAAPPTVINPWADLALAMMGQAPAAAARPEPEPEPEPQPEPPPEKEHDALARMVDAGREAQQQYIASLQNIFDRFWGAGPNQR